jgi:hypothetical protein
MPSKEEPSGRPKDDRPSEVKVARTGSPTEALPVTTEDLIPLIKAITFAYPHFSESPADIHQEIISVASRQEPLLASITLVEVEHAFNVLRQRTKKEDEVKQKVMKMYTIGDATNSSSSSNMAVGSQATTEATAITASSSGSSTVKRWVHVQLDVPADTSGSKPHQALINFTDNNSSGSSGEHSSAEDGKPSAKTASTSTASPASSEASVIVKIQVAMGGAESKTPMLLYNNDRSVKTFIHCTPLTVEGYNRIQRMILQRGGEGALGKAGGTKGYFYAKRHAHVPSNKKAAPVAEAAAARCADGEDEEAASDPPSSKRLYIDCLALAPDQTW